MSARPQEATTLHTRLLKSGLHVEEARAYWRLDPARRALSAEHAFEEYWFGARSLPRVKTLLSNLRARFDAFPPALDILGRWPRMEPDTRVVVCHWHLQLADPLYRAFTGVFLPERRRDGRPTVTRDRVTQWVEAQATGRWTTTTCVQFASKLLSASLTAGLVGARRDPRPLTTPRVPDHALAYLAYLLREVTISGSPLDNPYTRSVGLDPHAVAFRMRDLPGVAMRQQGDLIDWGWQHPDLRAWADAHLPPRA